MTRKRGRALIINNMNFEKRPDLCRKGSDVDVENLSAMLKTLKFDVVTHTNLKAKVFLLLFTHQVINLLLSWFTDASEISIQNTVYGFTGVQPALQA